jgi:hypothetical protein
MSTPQRNPRARLRHRTGLGSALVAVGASKLRAIFAAILAAVVAGGVLASPAAADPVVPTCPDTVIPDVAIIPNAVGCWNAIAVQTVRLATPYQVQGLIYLGYTQAAVYDAVTKIEGRYVPYDAFDVPAGVDVANASPDAATAAAAYTILTSPFLGLSASAQTGLSTTYSDYIDALGGIDTPRVAAGVTIGQAAAADLIADRAGDRDESITFTPGPLTAGGWTFAPPPSLQSAQTPWIAVMKPFMLQSPSQFRADPPPALSSRAWVREYNEVKAYGAVDSTVRSPAQTAVARFWNANAVNQSNQAFQDFAITHRMDGVGAARVLAMGDLVGSDAGIACWDSKYHYLFWRPIMAIRNAGLDENPATQPDPNWTPLLTTPNHPEYPSAHTCVTGAEAEVYAAALGTHHINITVHGSADGTPNNWAAIQTFRRVTDLQRQVANARVWGGLHYRGSTEAGLALARNVAHWTLQRYFLPTR